MTFPALPPEVNVGRLMSGAGPAPATAAAASWATVVASISSRSMFLTSLLPRLAASWQAPETALMTRNVAMYLTQNEAARAQAALAAARHTKQAADYTSALVGMAQIPEIVLNHVTNAVLNATNFLGVNTGAIATNEAQYAAMWAQNASMMTAYLANSTANMTFVPFVPPKPVATPGGVPIPAAAAGAASVGDAVVTKMTLAAQGAQAIASTAYMRTAGGVLSGTKLGQTVAMQSQRAEQAASNGQTAESKTSQSPTGPKPQLSGQELGRMLMQMGTQAPQMAAQVGQMAMQVPQQMVQATTHVGQVVSQPLSQMLTSIHSDNRTSSVGYFGAKPGSPSLERMSKGEKPVPGAAAVRGTSIAASPQVIAPSSWSTDGLVAPPPPPPMPRVPVEALRPIAPAGSPAPVARSNGRQRERLVVPDTTNVMPVYEDSAAELESVPVDAPAGGGDN